MNVTGPLFFSTYYSYACQRLTNLTSVFSQPIDPGVRDTKTRM